MRVLTDIDWSRIKRPSLILREAVVRHNIVRMYEKSLRTGLKLRPHFKTHQSAEIGEWFREVGVDRIAVSSVEMADYFAQAGWDDIFIAFPFNPREHARIEKMAERIRLSVLLDSLDALSLLRARVNSRLLQVWIEIDVGDGRSGLPWNANEKIVALASELHSDPTFQWAGLMTHAGHTYPARGREEVLAVHTASMKRMQTVKMDLEKAGLPVREVSVGDTPSCALAEEFPGATELRPGNFAFFDLMQVQIGSCEEKEIAVALACPVVARYPERGELILHGGAVHLGKDFCVKAKGEKIFGRLAWPQAAGWSRSQSGCELISLSQEHGLARVSREMMENVRIGDLLMVLPVHSCLTADIMGCYFSAESMAEGRTISSMRTRLGGFSNEIAAK